MIYAFDLEFYTDEGEVMGAITILLFLYGFSIIPFTYVFGFLFKSPGNA
jgi:ATP-binding cassette subfamily A (ABC1) protein 3